MARRIPLSDGRFALVDDADHPWLSGFRWHCQNTPSGHKYAYRYAKPNEGHPKGKRLLMHRELLGLTRAPRTVHVDHANDDTLDNRRANIRACNAALNQAASRIGRAGTSRYRGVYWDESRGKWRASVRCNGRTYHLGRFATEREAAGAYDGAARELFGEFARLNLG